MGQAQKGAKQAIRRSRSGLTTKNYAVIDVLGNPLHFEFILGQSHASVMVQHAVLSAACLRFNPY